MDSITWLAVKDALDRLWHTPIALEPDTFELAFREAGLAVVPVDTAIDLTAIGPRRPFPLRDLIEYHKKVVETTEQETIKLASNAIAAALKGAATVGVRESLDGETFDAIPVDDIDEIIDEAFRE